MALGTLVGSLQAILMCASLRHDQRAGDFGFLLTAVDGQLTGGGGIDRQDLGSTSGAVVYNNLLGASDDLTVTPQALGGGSIVITPSSRTDRQVRASARAWRVASGH